MSVNQVASNKAPSNASHEADWPGQSAATRGRGLNETAETEHTELPSRGSAESKSPPRRSLFRM